MMKKGEDTMSAHILVVEDDAGINELLCKILQKQGYDTCAAFSGSEAVLCLERDEYQLILLDLMLPGVTGDQLISLIRQKATVPIIVISAKNGPDTKVGVLVGGADDFISKPFDNNEVLARVEAQLRRYMVFSAAAPAQDTLTYKGVTLNRDTRKTFVNGKEITLTLREFDILELLMSYPGKVYTKANLFEHVWNDTFLGDDNTLNVHISNLRSKIAAVDPGTDYIQTVWGIGYKMA